MLSVDLLKSSQGWSARSHSESYSMLMQTPLFLFSFLSHVELGRQLRCSKLLDVCYSTVVQRNIGERHQCRTGSFAIWTGADHPFLWTGQSPISTANYCGPRGWGDTNWTIFHSIFEERQVLHQLQLSQADRWGARLHLTDKAEPHLIWPPVQESDASLSRVLKNV